MGKQSVAKWGTICSHKIKTQQRQEKPVLSGAEFPLTYNSCFPREGTDWMLS